MPVIAFVVGYLIGSIPSADWLARRTGIDLRRDGSGNPGANNARRLGGWRLAAQVLAVEMTKGASAVAVTGWLDPTWGALAGSSGAIAGNILNPWFRLRGGQGLGITAGVLLVAWPSGLAAALLAIGLGLRLFHTTRTASLLAVAALSAAGAYAHPLTRWGWGMETGHLMLAISLGAVITAKQAYLIVKSRR